MPDDVEAVSRKRRRPRRILRWALTTVVLGVVAYFFASSLASNWEQVSAQHLTFDLLWIPATVLFAVAVPLTGVIWRRVLARLDGHARESVSSVEAIAVQCASWLLKYIPGQVGSVINKVVWAGKKGISRTVVVISFVYENLFLQVASIVPSLAILMLSLGPQVLGANATLLLTPVLVLVPAIVIIYKPLFQRIVNVPARRLLKQEVPSDAFLSAPQAARFCAEFIGPRVLNGIGFVLLAATVSDVSPSEWLPFAAAYVLAGAIGILAVFVPSGLGVREAVIVLILGQYVPVAEAIIISLLARLLSTVGDAVVALIYVLLRRTISREYRP